MTTAFSVLILTSGRDAHLLNTLAGVARMQTAPDEVVVAFMDQPVHPAMPSSLNITALDVTSEARLPLAKARNALAAKARNDALLFLDVDCVPSMSFASLVDDLSQYGGLVMGSPRYLEPNASTADDQRMTEQSTLNASRLDLKFGPSNAFEMFWSLCFAITKTDFDKAGGFNDDLVGYGGEDTDFAFRCRDAGVGFALSSATVFHQDHASCRPPLNHFADIVENARTLYPVWGMWMMSGWLESFTKLGLIEWNTKGSDLRVIRQPSAEEVENARVSTAR